MKLTSTIPFKWRIQTEQTNYKTKKVTATCVAYVDGREVTQVLDDLFGFDGWTEEYYSVNNSTYCKIGVYSDKLKTFVYKSDAGETKRDVYLLSLNKLLSELDEQVIYYNKLAEQNNAKDNKKIESGIDRHQKAIKSINKELDNASKSEATDSFKRACVKLGIGRFLYSMDKVHLNVNDWDIVDDTGKILFQKNNFELLSNYCNKICSIPIELINEINNCNSIDSLEKIYLRMSNLKNNKQFLEHIKQKKQSLPSKD